MKHILFLFYLGNKTEYFHVFTGQFNFFLKMYILTPFFLCVIMIANLHFNMAVFGITSGDTLVGMSLECFQRSSTKEGRPSMNVGGTIVLCGPQKTYHGCRWLHHLIWAPEE